MTKRIPESVARRIRKLPTKGDVLDVIAGASAFAFPVVKSLAIHALKALVSKLQTAKITVRIEPQGLPTVEFDSGPVNGVYQVRLVMDGENLLELG